MVDVDPFSIHIDHPTLKSGVGTFRAKVLCERLQGFHRRFDRVRLMVDQANLWQVRLLQQTRSKKAKDALNMPLLMTMNCVAAGLGRTG